MQLGKAIVGAIIGAAIGIAVMVGVYLALKIDSVWLALPVAILTGLGVRMMVSTGGHASYLRGAITGVLALGAYLLGWNAVAGFATQRAAAAAEATRIERSVDDGEKAADDGDEAQGEDGEAAVGEENAAEAPKAAPAKSRQQSTAFQKNPMNTNLSALDFVVLCVSALIAYELGRGTAATPVVIVGDETKPQGTHPDA